MAARSGETSVNTADLIQRTGTVHLFLVLFCVHACLVDDVSTPISQAASADIAGDGVADASAADAVDQSENGDATVTQLHTGPPLQQAAGPMFVSELGQMPPGAMMSDQARWCSDVHAADDAYGTNGYTAALRRWRGSYARHGCRRSSGALLNWLFTN